MATAKLSHPVTSLGKRIVEELGLDETTDTLSRWMSHYIAQKIRETESQRGKARSAAERECFDAILELWAHRAVFPERNRPFGDFESLFHTLSTLDLENSTPRYFPAARLPAADEANAQTAKWFEAATRVDDAARVLIRYFLAVAVEEAVDKSREWVQLAEAVNQHQDSDIQIIRWVSDDVDTAVSKKATPEQSKVAGLIERLDALSRIAKSLSTTLEGRIQRPRSARGKKGSTPARRVPRSRAKQ